MGDGRLIHIHAFDADRLSTIYAIIGQRFGLKERNFSLYDTGKLFLVTLAMQKFFGLPISDGIISLEGGYEVWNEAENSYHQELKVVFFEPDPVRVFAHFGNNLQRSLTLTRFALQHTRNFQFDAKYLRIAWRLCFQR